MYYKKTMEKQEICLGECEPGCVNQNVYDMLENKECMGDNRWANNGTCVNIQDCMCMSNDGKPVKVSFLVFLLYHFFQSYHKCALCLNERTQLPSIHS